jgi:hypothetical protein
MSFASDLLPAMAAFRAIPGALGLRPNRVYVAIRTWTGTAVGEGTYTEVATELSESGQPPKVRDLSGEVIAVNNLESGTIEVGPLTPTHTGGGVAVATLEGTLTAKQERLLKVVGPDGTRYMRIADVSCDRALHYTVRAEPQVD